MPINQFLKESAGRFLTIEMPIGSPFSIKDNRRETRNHSPVVLDNKIKYPRRKEARQQIGMIPLRNVNLVMFRNQTR